MAGCTLQESRATTSGGRLAAVASAIAVFPLFFTFWAAECVDVLFSSRLKSMPPGCGIAASHGVMVKVN